MGCQTPEPSIEGLKARCAQLLKNNDKLIKEKWKLKEDNALIEKALGIAVRWRARGTCLRYCPKEDIGCFACDIAYAKAQAKKESEESAG